MSSPQQQQGEEQQAPSSLPTRQLTEVVVRAWKADKEDNIGHVSVDFPEHGLYVSFWPKKQLNKKTLTSHVPAHVKSYVEDKKIEKKHEDKHLLGDVEMDMAAVVQCWDDIRTNTKYSLATFNCVEAAMQVLSAGNPLFQVVYEAVQMDAIPFDSSSLPSSARTLIFIVKVIRCMIKIKKGGISFVTEKLTQRLIDTLSMGQGMGDEMEKKVERLVEKGVEIGVNEAKGKQVKNGKVSL